MRLNILLRGHIVQRGMRSDTVINALPFLEDLIEGGQIPIIGINLVELLGMRALGAFHTTIQLGGAWRQHKQADVLFLTGLLKFCHELTAAIHLHGFKREG
jgi:hypothetical protein